MLREEIAWRGLRAFAWEENTYLYSQAVHSVHKLVGRKRNMRVFVAEKVADVGVEVYEAERIIGHHSGITSLGLW
jgi:hypothetical protein